jgi:tripartite-type tricarboxylate transporter receptor subunit TctC
VIRPGKLYVLAWAAFVALGHAHTPAVAGANDYPTKPLRWIVPFPPGGPTDVVARVVGPKLAQRLDQPVVIENRPGAGGNVGTELVARGPADGTMILMVVPGLVTNPYFMRNSVDPRELQSVIQLTRIAFVLLASADFAPKTVPELIAAIKAKPGGVSCGTSGSLPTVGCALLRSHAQAEMLLVQYKGNAPALNALMSGEINLLFDVVNTALPQVRAGRVRAIASTHLHRGTGAFGDQPTLSETIPGFELVGWQGIMVARGTSKAIVERLNGDIGAVLATPEVGSRLQEAGLEIAGGSPEAFAQIVLREAERYGKVLTDAGIKPE